MCQSEQKINQVLEFVFENEYSLAYGLNPNPWGFSFSFEGEAKSDPEKNKELDDLLNDLTSEETKILCERYF